MITAIIIGALLSPAFTYAVETKLQPQDTPAPTFTAAQSIATGPGGVFITSSSSTASAFFGDGSHLTGVATTAGNNTLTSTNSFTGKLYISSSVAYGLTVKTSTITMSPGDGFFLANNDPGGITMTLPPASGEMGHIVHVIKKSTTTGSVTVAAASGDLINSTMTAVVLNAPGQSVELVSDGITNWFSVGAVPFTPHHLGWEGEPNTATGMATSSNTTYCAITVTQPALATGVRFDVGGIGASPKVDVGIFDSSLNKLASTGSVSVINGLLTKNFTTNAILQPGIYWLAIWMNTTTTSITRFGTGGSNLGCLADTSGSGSALAAQLGTNQQQSTAVRQYAIELLLNGGGTQ